MIGLFDYFRVTKVWIKHCKLNVLLVKQRCLLSPHCFCLFPYFFLALIACIHIAEWFVHISGWRDDSLAAFRKAFCEPSTTYNTLCAAPEVENVTSWCLANFNATNCGDIRAEAQANLDTFMITYYYGNAIWGIVLALLVSFATCWSLPGYATFCLFSFRILSASASRFNPGKYHFETPCTEIQGIKRTCLVFIAYSWLYRQRAAIHFFDLI